MGRWTNTTTYPNLASPDAADILPIADVSATAGTQQRTITFAQLSALAAESFLDLTDTPAAYTGEANKLVAVNGAANALEFITAPSASGDVEGPASAVDGNVATFNGTTGKLIQDGGTTVAKLRLQSFIIACSDETTALTTGTAKATFRTPYAFTLTAVRASVTPAPTGSVLTVDINEAGTSILSTKLTIDATEKTSTTAATAAVISDTSLADDAEITIDVDTVGSTVAGAGLKVALIGYAT